MNLTKLAKPFFAKRIKEYERYATDSDRLQKRELHELLRNCRRTEIGRRYNFTDISSYEQFRERVPLLKYEDIRADVMRMLCGERDILYPGVVRNYAQSSGTSDGKSKYIPITGDSFKRCHYRGGFDSIAHYLNLNPESKIFSGKAFILGGSFATEQSHKDGVLVGDLSANLIENIPAFGSLMRTPSKSIALMEDWEQKLPALIEASIKENVTNISGVPSWFLTVLQGVLERTGASCIHDVWSNLEVFFHGGINFTPYREQYRRICDASRMHYLETYNASEGFFALQTSWESSAMTLIIDNGVFYEFIPLADIDSDSPRTLPIWEVVAGETYSMIITANNGLWRYAIGDTVKVVSTNPVKITIAGRTKHYINAFGEELMVHNADNAIAATCAECNISIQNYTAAPVYATHSSKGRHHWVIEFNEPQPPAERMAEIATVLDKYLQMENSDYQAKRTKDIFLDKPLVTMVERGTFDRWLLTRGKLGGQRKIPRLSNTPDIVNALLATTLSK